MERCYVQSTMIFFWYSKKITIIRSILLGCAIALLYNPIVAQNLESVTIEQCYQWAKEQYPLSKQFEIADQTQRYNFRNASRGFWPQISINGKASYQSDVPKIPINIPGNEIPSLSKDQYNVYGELYQPISSSQWSIRKQIQIIKNTTEIEKQQLNVDLYKLRNRISELYFGILLTENGLKQISLVQNDLETVLKKIQAAVENGTAIESDKKTIDAELIKLKQNIEEYKANQNSFITMLAMLTGQTISTSTTFTMPMYEKITTKPQINRPELTLFGLQKKHIDIQYARINNRFWPDIGLFAKGGYGRPSLNFLNNNFDLYYIAGVKISWRLSSMYTSGNEKQILSLSKSKLDQRQETFLLNIKLHLARQANEIRKYEKLIASDKTLISIREDLKKTAQAKLTNGLISALDFIDYVNAEKEARQNLILHRIQLAMALYKYNIISGN